MHTDLSARCQPPEPGIVAFGASPRKGGNSDILLKTMAKGAREAGVDCRVIWLRDYTFSGCIGCEKCRKEGVCIGLHDGMNLLYSPVIKARGMIWVSPVHNYNITAWMKAFIDRLYCLYNFGEKRPGGWSSRLADQGRKAVIATVCEQTDPADMGVTLEAMRAPLTALGYELVSELAVLEIFDRGKVADYPETLEKARQTGYDLGMAVRD
jgi:multimeric flavodoxin WrbA